MLSTSSVLIWNVGSLQPVEMSAFGRVEAVRAREVGGRDIPLHRLTRIFGALHVEHDVAVFGIARPHETIEAIDRSHRRHVEPGSNARVGAVWFPRGLFGLNGPALAPVPHVLSRGPERETTRYMRTASLPATAAVVAPCEMPVMATSDQRTLPSWFKK